MNISFEDLPSSDANELILCLDEHKESLFSKYNAYPSVLGRSFYEKLYPSNSIDLSLSYITVHWLSCADSLPKRLVPVEDHCGSNSNFQEKELEPRSWVCANETCVPFEIFRVWQAASRADLRLFLHHRAEELKDNSEGVYLVVARTESEGINGNDWIDMKVLQKTIRHAFEKNLINEDSYKRIVNEIAIGIYLRNQEEVRSAFDESNETEDTMIKRLKKYNVEHPIFHLNTLHFSLNNRLKLVNVETVTIKVGQGMKNTDPMAELFWAIIENTIRASCNANESEMAALKSCMLEVHAEQDIDLNQGINCTYMYLRVKRKPRVQGKSACS